MEELQFACGYSFQLNHPTPMPASQNQASSEPMLQNQESSFSALVVPSEATSAGPVLQIGGDDAFQLNGLMPMPALQNQARSEPVLQNQEPGSSARVVPSEATRAGPVLRIEPSGSSASSGDRTGSMSNAGPLQFIVAMPPVARPGNTKAEAAERLKACLIEAQHREFSKYRCVQDGPWLNKRFLMGHCDAGKASWTHFKNMYGKNIVFHNPNDETWVRWESMTDSDWHGSQRRDLELEKPCTTTE